MKNPAPSLARGFSISSDESNLAGRNCVLSDRVVSAQDFIGPQMWRPT
jgi:hypothetical protein